MYAIIQIAGKQFKVKPGMVLNVPTLNVEPGKKFDVERVLAYSDGKDLTIGTPELKDITIKGSGAINVKASKNVVIKGKKILEN